MIEKYLWIAGSLPCIILGTIHLLYTFFTNKFSSRNKQLDEEMKKSFPVLTKEVTMWNAWVGFNASHSSGVIYIGLINLFTAIGFSSILHNPLFLLLNMVTVLFYLWLAKKYWFKTPFRGVLISTVCFTAAIIVILLK
jgi:hypothetical protein